MRYVFFILIAFYPCLLLAQSNDSSKTASLSDKAFQAYTNITSKSLNYINSKYSKLTITVQTQSEKLLTHMQRKRRKA